MVVLKVSSAVFALLNSLLRDLRFLQFLPYLDCFGFSLLFYCFSFDGESLSGTETASVSYGGTKEAAQAPTALQLVQEKCNELQRQLEVMKLATGWHAFCSPAHCMWLAMCRLLT